jgi:RimJ/RimL family protein N-acetyltransferase
MAWPEPVTLRSGRVTLEPLARRHEADLVEAAKDGELWRLWYTSVPSPEGMSAEIGRRLGLQAVGSMLPFAVIDTPPGETAGQGAGKAVGMTTYMNIDAAHKRVEIGSTWYRKAVQRTDLNTRCKLLLLGHAFETLNCIAVEFRTHFFNRQSRAGIERLGAKLDGILRSHQVAPNGSLRDTCVYSIIAAEWPTVKAHLEFQLSKPSESRVGVESRRTSMAGDIEAVEKVVWVYLDGLYEGDTGKLGQAFHEVSHLYGLRDGGVDDMPREQWFDLVDSRPSPKARGLRRTDRIVSVDFSGPETAFVKVECSIHPRYFTDYLTLLKLKDGWRIVSKTYRTDVRE